MALSHASLVYNLLLNDSVNLKTVLPQSKFIIFYPPETRVAKIDLVTVFDCDFLDGIGQLIM